jgi:hypothetical protein
MDRGRVSRQLLKTFINFLDSLQRKQINKILEIDHDLVCGGYVFLPLLGYFLHCQNLFVLIIPNLGDNKTRISKKK